MAARTSDEHGPLYFRCDADERLACHFTLGNKCDGRNRADDNNIGPRNVIGDVEDGTVVHRRAVHPYTYSKQCAQHPIVIRSDEASTGQSELG